MAKRISSKIGNKRTSKKKTVKSKEKKDTVGSYFVHQDSVEFIPSGCAVLDCVLGGGWALGRISNIIGDKSTGKTLLAMEAFANFAKQYEEGAMYYLEAEAAFDKKFAESLGMPVNQINFVEDVNTVEEMEKTLNGVIAENDGRPIMFVVDSLDALSDKAEQERDIDKESYGTAKARKMSELFRRLTGKIEASRMHLMIISQIRDNINALWGRKWTRNGGKALDFYASQVLVLKETGKRKETKKRVERTVGVHVHAGTDKCKVGIPFRDCEFDIVFGYGIDSVKANLFYLQKVNQISRVDSSLTTQKAINEYIKKHINTLSDREYAKYERRLSRTVRKAWNEVETQFLPTRRKY